MKRFINTTTILLFILFLAAFLRLWKLGTIPPHLTSDEAALGYNAYSILKTGKDFWGESLPIVFKSFGDYTPGLYVYLAAPFIGVMGLNELSVRLPNAIFGVIIVYFVFHLARIIFEKAKYKNFESIALFSGFLAATNPWLIHFSRGAWVPNLAFCLTLIGIYFFMKSFEKNRFLFASAIFFGLTLISYQGAKLSTPIVVLLLGLLFFKNLIRFDKKVLLGSFGVGIIISLPILISVYTGYAGRLTVVSTFSYPRSETDIKEILEQGGEKPGGATYLAFHSESLNWVRVIMGKWFNHFSGRFLFFEGDWNNPRHNSINMGMFLLADSVLILAGLTLFIRRLKNKYFLFLLLWLVLAPVPSILSRDPVHGVRSLHMAIPLIIISSLALHGLFANLSKNYLKRIAIWGFVALYFLNYIYYLDSYYVHLPKHGAKYWEFGYREAVQYLKESNLNSRQVVFQQSYAQPFIYFLFYDKRDPQEFWESAVYESSSVGDVGLVSEFKNLKFQYLSWPYKYPTGTIVVADEIVAPRKQVISDYSILKEVLRPDGSLAYLIMEAK